MIADSSNTEPLFISDPPDWSKPYSFAQIWQTIVTKSQNGSEQRGKPRHRPRFSLSYEISAMTIAEQSVKRANMIDYLGAPIVVPAWHAWELMAGKSTNGVTLSTTETLTRAFKIGSYAYLEAAGFTSCFREITAIGASSLTFAAGNAAFPDIVMPLYPVGAKVYPCIFGVYNENAGEFFQNRHDQTDHGVSVVEI